MSELKNRLEAILFASGKGISESDLVDYTEAKLSEIKKELEKLKKEYEERESSLAIIDIDKKWKISVKGKYTLDVQKIVSETELPKPILKTLAVVAYKSPVLQSDIIHMRGQSAYDHIKVLTKQKLITKDEHGRSYILKITDKFYNYFDVDGDEDIRDMFKKLREMHEQKLGELEIVDIPENKNKENKIGDLEVVPIEVKTAQRSDEELKEEEEFLKKMDEKINVVSKRVEKHELPDRHTHPELEKEQKTIDDTTTSIEDVKREMDKEKIKEKNTQNSEDEKIKEKNNSKTIINDDNQKDPIKEIEKFVRIEEEKEEKEDQFI